MHFFIDLQELTDDNLEDAVFSWSKRWREYKALVEGNGKYILSKLKQEKILPLTFLAEESNFWKLWYSEFRNLFNENEAQKIENYVKKYYRLSSSCFEHSINRKTRRYSNIIRKNKQNRY